MSETQENLADGVTDAKQVPVTVGQMAPDFQLLASDGSTVTLEQLRATCERGVVIFFYPRALTPGCTTEACDFRDSEAQLLKAGYKVVGISPDKHEKLQQFAAEHQLAYPLLSDPQREVMAVYGAFGEKKNYGKTVTGVIRSTAVVAADGTVLQLWRNVKAKGHVARVLRDLEVIM